MIAIIFYALIIWDILLNCCGSNKTVPKYKQNNKVCQGQHQYSFRQPYQHKLLSLFSIGSQSIKKALIQQVKLYLFSLLMGQRYRKSWFSFGSFGYRLYLQSDSLLLQTHVHLVRSYDLLLTRQSWYNQRNLGYTLATNPIYEEIDWKSGKSYAWVIATAAVIAIIHILGQLIWYKCKRPKLEELLRKEGKR